LNVPKKLSMATLSKQFLTQHALLDGVLLEQAPVNRHLRLAALVRMQLPTAVLNAVCNFDALVRLQAFEHRR
jgi:hypothetical protein